MSKEVHFQCQHCGQKIATDPKTARRDLDCPTCGRRIYLSELPVRIVLYLIAVPAIIFLSVSLWKTNSDVPRPETDSQRLTRLAGVAHEKMLVEATNDIVGLSRIIRAQVLDYEDNPDKWTGQVDAEFVNHFGGIDRTNLPFIFRQSGSESDGTGSVECRLDFNELGAREIHAFEARMKAIEASAPQ